jgi:hypothetical protein
MRRSVITVTLLLPFVLAALPLLAIFMTGSSPAYAGGTIAVSPSVAVVATARTEPVDSTLAQAVAAQAAPQTCVDSTTGAQS